MKDIEILLAEDDEGHANLICRNLKRSGISNEVKHFKNGKKLIDFLYDPAHGCNISYLILLDIRMPIMDGIEALEIIKSDEELKAVPVIMLTTTDNPVEVKKCHLLGCNNYIVKPVSYESFVEALHNLGLFLRIVTIPEIQKKNETALT